MAESHYKPAWTGIEKMIYESTCDALYQEKTTFEITCEAMWRGASPFLVLADMGAPRCSIMSTTFSCPDLQK